MKRFRQLHLASFVLALTLLSSLLFSSQATSHVLAGPPAPGAAQAAPKAPQANVVTTTDPVGTFTTIQDGINFSNPGGTVNVSAGTYVEQVDIGKAITLHGAGQGSTIIQSPASLVTKFSTKKPIVYVHDANAVVQNLTVDGLGLGNTNNVMVGVAFYNAGGVLDHTTIVHVRNTPLDGIQGGVGIYAFIDNATPRTLTVDRNTINDYQKNGMALNGVGLTAIVTNNTVAGAGNTNKIAQNGIQIGFGGTGSITGNVISDNFCSAPVCIGDPATSNVDGAAGILLYANNNPSITVANNLLTGNQYGLWGVAVPAVNIHDNTILGAGGVGVALWNGDGGQTPQGTTGTINHNTFNGLLYGLLLRDYVAAGPALATTGAQNHFIGNTSYGAWSDVPNTNLANNWWNAPSGPGGAGPGSGDAISANILYSPFLTDPPAYAHFQPGNQITVGLGGTVTLDLLVNAGSHPAVAQQSYLTFPAAQLQNVNPTTGLPSSTVTQDSGTFPTLLQNVVNNTTGEIAFASGMTAQPPPAPPGAPGDFRVAQVTFAANTLGDATVHWQFSPPDPANRNSKISDAASVVSDRTLYQDYVIHVVTPQFTGHVFWQGRSAQPNSNQVLPLDLTLTNTGTDYHFNGLTTDANGNFTVALPTMPNGTYAWRVKGPTYLSTSGTVVYNHASSTVIDMGLQPAGDANNDNLADVSDFGILYATFGQNPLVDTRADWTGDGLVDITDFGLLSANFGHVGNRPAQQPAAPQTGGSAVLELRPQGKAPANGGTVHVGDRFVLELWVNAQPGTTVNGQQSYLTFPANTLHLGGPTLSGPGTSTPAQVIPDTRVLDLTLQNVICNSLTGCTVNGQSVPGGSLAFASGTFAPTGGSGAFRIGQVTVQATAPGLAQLHWQLGPTAPANRTTKLLTHPTTASTQDLPFVDYTLTVLPAGK
jgi:hypothetical protein